MTDKNDYPVWPGWETVRLIGRGSFGAVYEIQRDVLGEKESAALKLISIPQNPGDVEEMISDGYDSESITETFQGQLKSIVAEYSLMRKMNGSANVVNCDDVRYIQHENGIGWDIFIKMELLTPMIKAIPEKVDDAYVTGVAADLCHALNLCKKYDIVHRDIKPQNIFVSNNGDYKLGDFGIAKTVERTMGGTKIGTYKYMAPEVYNNQPYGSAADIYSLGLVLYWLLNERRMPFMPLPPERVKAGDEEKARLRRFNGEQIPAPKNGSAELKRIVLKACAYDVYDRYHTADEMLADLKKLQKDVYIPHQTEEPPPEADPPGNDVPDDTDEDDTDTFGVWGRTEKTTVLPDGSKIVSKLTPDRKKLKDTCYNAGGELRYISEYDPGEKEIKRTEYTDGKISTYSAFKYDAVGRLIHNTRYNAGGEIISYLIYEYAPGGEKIKETACNGDGTIDHTCEYDLSGALTKRTYYRRDRSVERVCEFNSNGNVTKETHYHADAAVNYVSEYVPERNITRKTFYNADGTIERICEYDPAGNLISEKILNARRRKPDRRKPDRRKPDRNIPYSPGESTAMRIMRYAAGACFAAIAVAVVFNVYIWFFNDYAIFILSILVAAAFVIISPDKLSRKKNISCHVAGGCFAAAAVLEIVYDCIYNTFNFWSILFVIGYSVIAVGSFISLPELYAIGSGICAFSALRFVIATNFSIYSIMLMVAWALMIAAFIIKKNAKLWTCISGSVLAVRFAGAIISWDIVYSITPSFLDYFACVMLIAGAFWIGYAVETGKGRNDIM